MTTQGIRAGAEEPGPAGAGGGGAQGVVCEKGQGFPAFNALPWPGNPKEGSPNWGTSMQWGTLKIA